MVLGQHPPLSPRRTGALACVVVLMWLTASQAQVTLDGSLGPQSALSGPNYVIPATLGQLRGPNLFQSFRHFNIGTGESATFTGPNTVQNILSRVTGGQPSSINGALRSDIPGANLYLLNPSGVVFGPQAALDVQGAFHVSTADYLRLADGARFSARLSDTSQLSVAPPAAFGFLGPQAPAAVTVQSASLQVPDGSTLSIIGGDLQVNGATLSARGGRINLASVASAGEALPATSSAEPALRVEAIERGGQVGLSAGARLDVSGRNTGGGTVTIRSGRLVMTQTTLTADTPGDAEAARTALDLQATQDVTMAQSTATANVSGSGRGGDIRVQAGTVDLHTATALRARGGKDSAGARGDISITADSLRLTDGARLDTNTDGAGGGGNITVQASNTVSIAGRDSVTNLQSGLVSDTTSTGSAGRLAVTAPTVTLDDSVIRPRTGGTGSGGSAEIQTERLTLTGGAQIASTTFAAGPSGDITVNATEAVTISGRNSNGTVRSGISGATVAGSSGPGGRVTVTSPNITVDDGFINTQAQGNGDAGTVSVQAGQLTLAHGASIDSNTFGTGRGGMVTVQASGAVNLSGRSVDPDGTVRQSQIASRAGGQGGAAGQVSLTAPSVTVSEDGLIRATTDGRGKAGDIALQVDTLTVRDGGQISTGTSGAGQGGTVTVSATGSVTVRGKNSAGVPSALATASSSTGRGGNLQLQAQRIEVRDGGEITAASAGEGDAGAIHLRATETLRGHNGRVTTASEQTGGGNITLDASLVHLTASDVTATVRGGTGGGGNIDVHTAFTVLNNGRVVAQADLGRGGNINITAQQAVVADPQSVVDASAQRGINGTVDIRAPVTNVSGTVAPLPQSFAPSAALLRERCTQRRSGNTASRFVLGGRDGVPAAPGGMVSSRPLMEDTAPAQAEPAQTAQLTQPLPTQYAGLEIDCTRWSAPHPSKTRQRR